MVFKTRLVVPILALSGSITASPASISDPFNWKPCDGLEKDSRFQCGVFQVPLNYSLPAHLLPTSQHIPIVVLKFSPATYKPENGKRKTVLLNPGGPGGSGVDFAKRSAERLSETVLGNEFDVLGFDPRGVGRSQPVRCFDNSAIHSVFDTTGRAWTVAPLVLPSNDSVSLKEAHAWRVSERLKVQIQGCEKVYKDFLQGISTTSTARDMDFIREALGEEKLNYMGYSYGTFLGTMYANLFPDKVGRMVLDGVMSAVEAVKGPWESETSAYRHLDSIVEKFAEACEEVGSKRCALAKDGEERGYILPNLKALAYELADEPVVDVGVNSPPHIFRSDDLLQALVQATYRPTSWPKLAEALRPLVFPPPGSARNASLLLNLGGNPAKDSQELCTATTDFSGQNSYAAVTCNDFSDVSSISLSDWQLQAQKLAKEHTFFYAGGHYDMLPCKHFTTRPWDRFEGPFTPSKKLSNKILLVGNVKDPVTPLEEAQQIQKVLGDENSVLLTSGAYGHCSSSQKSACVERWLRGYMVDGVLPEPGERCEPDEGFFPEDGLKSLNGGERDVVADALLEAQIRGRVWV
ncbi:hypothetical protein HDV05_007850 [Chytridiales sp. JEL 0842]|nr:hypothetical protein HDV05_007850 [Chytridiales sp. JEL 0842]